MKQYILLFVCMLACLDLFPGTRSETFSLTFDKSEFTMHESSDGKQYIITEKTDYDYLGKDSPGLPVRAISIALPCGYEYESFKVSASRSLLKTGVTMSGSPISFTTDTEITPETVTEYTYGEGVYPSQLCSLTHSEEYQGMRILYFRVSPFEYRTADKSLYFISNVNLTVTMNNTPSTGAERPGMAGGLRNRDLLESILYNPEVLDSYPVPLRSSGIDPQNEQIQYLIVTNEELRESFKPLAEWKRIKGIPSKIITMEEIEAKYTEGDAPLKLKKCLYDLYQNNGLKYVLLGGDDTVVPVRGCFVACGEIKDKTIPTDLYFACFDGCFDWDKNRNLIFGEPDDDVCLIPSIYLTRTPVRTLSDTESFVKKIISYETAPIWNNKILMGGMFLFSKIEHEDRSDAEVKGDLLYGIHIMPNWRGTRFKLYDTCTDITDIVGQYPFTSENLQNQMLKGYDFVDIATHGYQSSWMMQKNSYYTRKLGQSQSNSGYTIITTMACLTNAFDSSEEGGELDPCLSESLIRNADSGVVAYLGCSRYGWGEHGKVLGASLKYEACFYRNLFHRDFKGNQQFGEVVARAKSEMVSSSLGHSEERWVQFGLNPIGDPEMPVFISEPRYFNLAYVTCTDDKLLIDSGESGCRICISSVGGDSSFYNIYDDSQTISLDEFPKSFNVCITKDGYVPFVYKVTHMQNETIQADTEISSDLVKIGSAVHPSAEGPVKISGGTVNIRGTEVLIEGEFEVTKGAEVTIEN